MTHFNVFFWLTTIVIVNSAVSSCTYGDTVGCLQDRAILIIGTSVSRHWFFELQSALTRKGGLRSSTDTYVDYLETKDEWLTSYRDSK